jgi:hypothetical protein
MRGVDWIHRAQDSDHWWALVNTALDLPVPLNVVFLSNCWLSSMELVIGNRGSWFYVSAVFCVHTQQEDERNILIVISDVIVFMNSS